MKFNIDSKGVSNWLFIDSAFHHRVWLMFGLSLMLRGLIVGVILLNPQLAMQVDSSSYLNPARNTLLYGEFSNSPAPPYLPEATRTPAYPAFLYIFMALFGETPYTSIVIAQAVIGALTSVLVMWLGETLFDRRVGTVGGLLHVIDPIHIFMVGWIMTETLYISAMIAGLALITHSIKGNGLWQMAAGGACLGLASLVRPIGLWILIPLVLALFFYQRTLRTWLRQIIPLVLAYSVVIAPWMARNYVLFGRMDLSNAMDSHLFYYDVPGFKAEQLGVSLDEGRAYMAQRLAESAPLSDRWPLALEGAVARTVIMENLPDFLWYHSVESVKGIFRPGFSFALVTLISEADSARDSVEVFAHGDPSETLATLFSQSSWLILLNLYMIAFTWGLLGLAAIGLIRLAIERRWYLFFLLGVLPALLVYPPGISANARYRSPVEPLLIYAAIVGAMWIADRIQTSIPMKIFPKTG